MDGKFPLWNAQCRHNDEVSYNTSQECQGLDNTNNIPANNGEVTVAGNYRESMFPHTLWPERHQNKEADLIRGMLSVEAESSSTHSDFSSDCLGILPGTAADSGKYLYFPVNQCSIRSNIGEVAESYGETAATERRGRCILINNGLPAGSISDVHISAQNQDLKGGSSSHWTSVIKEALEMSNGMELEQDLSVDMCGTALMYEELETRVLDPVKDHFHSIDYMSSFQERDKRTGFNRDCNSSVSVLSDGTNMSPVKSNQDVRQRRIIQELFSTDGSSLNDRSIKGTECSTLEKCPLLGFQNATEVCSLEQPTAMGVCPLEQPTAMGVCPLEPPTATGLCALEPPATTGVCALEPPAATGVCALEPPAATGVCALEPPAATGVCALEPPAATGVCALEPPAATGVCALEKTEVSSLTKKPCVSERLGVMRFNMEEQSKNLHELASEAPSLLSESSGNENRTLPSAATVLVLTAEHGSYNIGHAQSCKGDSTGKCAISHTEFSEEKVSKGDNATVPTHFGIPDENVKVQVAQITKLECDSQNLMYNIDQMGQHGCTQSEININLNNTELQNEKPALPLIHVEENRYSNITDETNISNYQHCPSKTKVHNEKVGALWPCVFNSNSAEPNCVCSSTSVSKLQDLVRNLCKIITPTTALKFTEPYHTRTDSTNEVKTEKNGSNLPPAKEVYLSYLSNAESRLAKESVFTTEAFSAVHGSHKVKKKKPVKRKTGDLYAHGKKKDNGCGAKQPHNVETQEPSLPSLCVLTVDLKHSDEAQDTLETRNTAKLSLSTPNKQDFAACQITEDSAKIFKILRCPRKTLVSSNIPEFPEPYAFENVQEASPTSGSENVFSPQNPQNALKRQKMPRKRNTIRCETLAGQGQKIGELTSDSEALTCDGTEMQFTHKSGDLHPKRNFELLSIKKDETEYERVSFTTDVPQSTKRKQRIPKKIKILPEENNKILVTSYSSSVGGCESPTKKLHLQEETLFSPSKKTEIQNTIPKTKLCNAVAFIKQEPINMKDNNEMPSHISCKTPPYNAVPDSEDKESLLTKRQRSKRALRIDGMLTLTQNHSPYEDSSPHTDSTSIMGSNRSTNIKKTKKIAKKRKQETRNAATVEHHAVDCSASHSQLQSSAVTPVPQTRITGIVSSKVIPKKPRKKSASEVKNNSAQTPTTCQAVSQQENSILPLVLETLESRVTFRAESSVKAKRRLKKSCKKERNTDITNHLTEGPAFCEASDSADSLSVSEISCLNLGTQNTKKSKKRSSKLQNETEKLFASSNSLLEQSNPAPYFKSQSSMKFIKSCSNKNVECVKSESNVKTPTTPQETMDSENAFALCGFSSTPKENGQKAQDHSDTQTDSKQNMAQRLDNTPDLQLDFCIMKTSEELLKCDQNKNVVKKKAKKSQKNTKTPGTVDPYLFTETVSPVQLENRVQPLPEIKVEPEKPTKEVKNNLNKPRQQQSSPKKHPFVWKTSTKNVNLDPEGHHEMPVTQQQVSDSLDKEMVSIKVDCSTELEERDYLKRIQRSLQRKGVGRPYKKKTLIKMAKLLSAIQETSGNITNQDLQKVPQSVVFKDLIKSKETRTDSLMNTSRKSCRSLKNCSYLPENTGNCSSNMSSDPCEGLSNLEESDPFHSQTTTDRGTLTHNCIIFSGERKKSAGRGRPSKKQRKDTALRAQITQTAALDEAQKGEQVSSEQPSKTKNKSRKSSVTMKHDPKCKKNMSIPPMECVVSPCQNSNVASEEIKSTAPESLVTQKIGRPKRKRVLLKNAMSSNLEKPLEEWNISSPSDTVTLPQTVPSHSKRQGKKSNMKSASLQLSNLRHSKRLAKVKGVQKPDVSAANNNISSHSQAVCQRDMKKAKKSTKRQGAPNQSNCHEPLPNQSSCDVTDEKHQNTDRDGIGVSGTSPGHYLKISENKEMQLVARIPSVKRKQKFNSGISSSAESLSNHAKKKKKCDQKKAIKQPSNVVAECGEKRGVKTGSRSKITKFQTDIGQVTSRKTLGEQLQQKPTERDKLLDLSEGSLETEIQKDILLRDDEKSSIKDFHADASKMLPESQNEGAHFALLTNTVTKLNNKNMKGIAHRKKSSYDQRKKEKVLSIKPNDGDAFETSQQSSGLNTRFHSGKIDDVCCDKKIKEQELGKLSNASLKVSDEHKHMSNVEDLGRDITLEDSPGAKIVSEAVSHQRSQVLTADGFTQYCDEDYMATLNKADETAKRGSLKQIAKKTITCKYCGRIFHHISAYIAHRRIHTGEKPYGCKHCGKNFAHLSKFKSHKNVHVQPTSLKCPCCAKKFSQKYDLVSHFKVHLQESSNKPSKITQCKPSVPSDNNDSLTSKICNNYPNKFMLKSHMNGRENLLSCKACGKTFRKLSHLVAHEKTHWPVKPYACSICGKGFIRLKALKNHSRKHTGETPFSCCHCSHAFSDLSALRAHQASKLCIGKQQLNGTHSDIEGFLVNQGVDGQVNTPVFFKCQICKQLYQKWCQYTLHLQTHTKSPPYLCFSCGQSYDKDSEVSIHCKVCCHSSGEEVSCGASLTDFLNGDTQKCTYSQYNSQINSCSLQTSIIKNGSQSSVLQSEEKSQTDDNYLLRTEHITSQPCPALKDSSLPETLHLPDDDQFINSSPPSPSPSVMSCASSNNSLECIEISPSLWKFECPRCGQRYERYRTLCAHMQTHAPSFRYVCGHCGQSFERWNRLWLHQRIHRAKSRCYSCSQCNLQFMFFSSYKDHMISHAGERPFACPLCPQTFVHEDALHAHQCALHQPSYSLQCDVCAKSFSSLRNLVKHSHLHNGTVSHQCLKCNLSFTNKKALQEHLNMHNNSLGLPLPDIPSEPFSFPYTCKRCKASFSTGDLLYAHQICHSSGSRSHGRSAHSNGSTSLLDGSLHPCTECTTPPTRRSLISTLNLDTIPSDESIYTYPHPDKLYVIPSLSTVCLQVINLDSEDETLQQTSSNGHVSPSIMSRSGLPGQSIPHSTEICTETDTTDLPQASERQEPSPNPSLPTECLLALDTQTITDNIQAKALLNDLTWTDKFVQMSVFLEGPTTCVNTDEKGEQEESFECADCSERFSRLEELHEHYFLHALGNKCLNINEKILRERRMNI
ncbi:uncharacterized protein si:ch73-347e22.4 isoform X2 [Electrophorus electricus]|uniref:uncharacterized protein si:ch73-347e22.4 isoform X2 n=1 Tax=Electrophorus electricus TaxID=8005 RepID=UPI0015D08670|nr:uncharacterized protein si:ch73-347e22.4 isoform X2 [Electrophorus electricus]